MSPVRCSVVNQSARGAPIQHYTRFIRSLGVPVVAWAPARFDEGKLINAFGRRIHTSPVGNCSRIAFAKT